MLAEDHFHFSYIYLHEYFNNFSKFTHHTILILIFNQLKLQKIWVTESSGVQWSPTGLCGRGISTQSFSYFDMKSCDCFESFQ